MRVDVSGPEYDISSVRHTNVATSPEFAIDVVLPQQTCQLQ